MRFAINNARLKVYLSVGAAYMSLWLFIDALDNPDTFLERIVNNAWLTAYLVVLNFIFFEYALPLIKFNWQRLLLAPVILFTHLILYSAGFYAWRSIGIALRIYFELKVHKVITAGIEYHAPYSFASIFFFAVVIHIYDYVKLKHTAQKLRIEKQEAELNFLRSQTNPHFLFNTLNNIYSLSREKSDLAPEAILRLSKILRFMLYDTAKNFISIEQELKIIRDYIELEKLRYDESLRINFNYNVEDMQQAVQPLLLVPLVENAFKHGVSETRRNPFIDIHLSINQRQLEFVVKNSTEGAGDSVGRGNIGLTNLRRQLELLYSSYQLQVAQDDGVFTATLNINLASHVKY